MSNLIGEQTEFIAESVFSALHHFLSPSLSSPTFNHFSPCLTHYRRQLQQSYNVNVNTHVNHPHIKIIIFSVSCISNKRVMKRLHAVYLYLFYLDKIFRVDK
jgi:hypothetical protein